jgi:hypothetical protein
VADWALDGTPAESLLAHTCHDHQEADDECRDRASDRFIDRRIMALAWRAIGRGASGWKRIVSAAFR